MARAVWPERTWRDMKTSGLYKMAKYLQCQWNKVANRFFRGNRIKGKFGNKVSFGNSRFYKTRIIFEGKDNHIVFEDACFGRSVSVYVHGNKNRVAVGRGCYMNRTEFHMEDDSNAILVGTETTFAGKVHLAAIESTEIEFGNDCLLSSDIQLRTGDSHSILDAQGVRANPSESIFVGSHVWFGVRVICLKGVYLADGCVIGAGAVITQSCRTPNCVLAGFPAKPVREGIRWKRERL